MTSVQIDTSLSWWVEAALSEGVSCIRMSYRPMPGFGTMATRYFKLCKQMTHHESKSFCDVCWFMCVIYSAMLYDILLIRLFHESVLFKFVVKETKQYLLNIYLKYQDILDFFFKTLPSFWWKISISLESNLLLIEPNLPTKLEFV